MHPIPVLCMAAATALLSACSTASHPPSPGPQPVTIANPASVYCIQQSGKLRLEKTERGAYMLCNQPNAQAVEEWEYFRRAHPATP